MAIHAALEKDHADPIADEFFAEISWYLENVPPPGSDEEQYKAAKDAEKAAEAEGSEGRGDPGIGDEVPLDSPEDEEGAPVKELPDDAGAGTGAKPAPKSPGPVDKEADDLLDAPPAE